MGARNFITFTIDITIFTKYYTVTDNKQCKNKFLCFDHDFTFFCHLQLLFQSALAIDKIHFRPKLHVGGRFKFATTICSFFTQLKNVVRMTRCYLLSNIVVSCNRVIVTYLCLPMFSHTCV